MSYLNAFGVNNDFGLATKADNPHLPATLGVDKRICFGFSLKEWVEPDLPMRLTLPF